jgi:hypothetical protein
MGKVLSFIDVSPSGWFGIPVAAEVSVVCPPTVSLRAIRVLRLYSRNAEESSLNAQQRNGRFARRNGAVKPGTDEEYAREWPILS